MFLMHAFYGLGATISPLVSTEFVKRVPGRVYLYFCVSLGLAMLIFVTVVVVFRGRTEDQVVGRRAADVPRPMRGKGEKEVVGGQGDEGMRESGEKEVLEGQGRESNTLEGSPGSEGHEGGSGGKVKAIMRTPSVHYMAFYLLIYVCRLSPNLFRRSDPL